LIVRGALLFSAVLLASLACDVKVDSSGEIAPVGVLRGTVSYTGPAPCSANGHIVGAVVILLFAADDPPPPAGIASSAVNFATVPADVLFANEPRKEGDTYCPAQHGDTAVRSVSAPYAVSPLAAGTYIAEAFYDASGTFLPEFSIRESPVRNDVTGGYIDTVAAAAHLGDPTYVPTFLPITIGVPAASDGGGSGTSLVIPPSGYLQDNVPITLAQLVSQPPPYFYPDGADAAGTTPVLSFSQDLHVLAPPTSAASASGAMALQASFPQLKLDFGLPAAEATAGRDLTQPFHFAYLDGDGFDVYSRGQLIAEGTLPALWPQVALTKLADKADGSDPQELLEQGSASADPTLPEILLQGITLSQDSLLATVAATPPTTPDATTRVGHFTAMLRPSVICLDPAHVERGGVLVTPYTTAAPADDPGGAEVPLFDDATVIAASGGLVREVKRGCLPPGRYSVHLAAPSGQTWTTPNEAGGCAVSEGTVTGSADPASCSGNGRGVLRSQGMRAVVEITAATSAEGLQLCSMTAPVPSECLQNP
jgi:hypothetical protein